MNDKNIEVFENAPIPKAVLTNAIPSIISMLMVLVYNLADTFFIGQTHDALQVAAVSIATPVFLLFLAVGILFGVGCTSVISRALGASRKDYARKVASFGFWSAIASGVAGMFLLLLFMDKITNVIGSSDATGTFVKNYLVVVSFGAPLFMITIFFSNVIRAEGNAKVAMNGMLIGNLVNIILDPIMILWFGWGITGAAFATVIGNTIGAMYYFLFFFRGKSLLSISLREFSIRENIPREVLYIGIPASITNLLMSISNIIINTQLALYSDMAVAGYGVAIKITMLVAILVIGFGQGVQPVLGFNYGAKNWKRFNGVMRFSLYFSTGLSVVLTLLSYLALKEIVGLFLTEPTAFDLSFSFAKVLLVSGPSLGALFVFMNAIQALGASRPAFILSVCRQGLFFIPILFLLNHVMGLDGLVMAQPIADYLSCLLSGILFFQTKNKLRKDDINTLSFTPLC